MREKRVLIKSVLAVAAGAVALVAMTAQAGTYADVRIINRTTGAAVPAYSHEGRLYVAGRPGDRYAVQVQNRIGERILAVVSVDGVNAVSGETAGPQQSGYVLAPFQSYDVGGWRKSTSEIAAFYFTTLSDSYAARTDRPANVGVIGVALFRELPPPRPVYPRPIPHAAPMQDAPSAPQRSQSGAAPSDTDSTGPASTGPTSTANEQKARAAEAPAAGASSADSGASPALPPALRRQERIGTGHGERERSDVTYTSFRRASPNPSEVLTIHYDSQENLIARGIIPGVPPMVGANPFPNAVLQGRFVPDPRH